MKTILFVQGLGMNKHEWHNSFDEIAGRLCNIGYNTVQFDFPIFFSGITRELPLKKRAKFVEDIVGKSKSVGLIAQSYGALTAMVAKLPTIKTQIFVSPALSPMHSIRQVYEEVGVKINYKGDTIMPRSSGENTTVGMEFWEDIKNFNDVKLARTITTPICIFHGDEDSKVPVPTVQTFFDAIPVKRKKLKIYRGGDHGIIDVPHLLREEFLQDVVKWFTETLP